MRQVLGPGALGKPRGNGWRGRWEGGWGWGTHVNKNKNKKQKQTNKLMQHKHNLLLFNDSSVNIVQYDGK